MAYKITEECISCGACEPECKIHRSVLRFALWNAAFPTLLTRKRRSNCWKSGASYTLARLRPPPKIKFIKHFRRKAVWCSEGCFSSDSKLIARYKTLMRDSIYYIG
jgi:ferredoxin